MWEEFRRRAFPLLGEHFPPNLIKDNGDSIVFVDRRERLRFLLTESTQGITIGDYEERNTVGIIFTSPSIELATIALTLLVREGLGERRYGLSSGRASRPRAGHRLQHHGRQIQRISPHPQFRQLAERKMRIFYIRPRYRRGLGPLPGFTAAVESRQSVAHAEEE